ncbi:MAG: hypothetical protein OCU22_09285 [Canidatus Methanoxibalbensis ujae]|nr:hypothetical protein [Candidatus Methanoxibalbensis ujae]
MALQSGLMVKTGLMLSDGASVSITADTGESLLIKDVIVCYPTVDYADFYIDKTSVGRFRVKGKLGNHLAPALGNGVHLVEGEVEARRSMSILRFLEDAGIFKGFPVAEGQTFSVKPADPDETLGNAVIVYEKYDAGDITAENENGTNADTYLLLSYGKVSASVNATYEYKYDESALPAEFPQFPFEEVVPAKTVIEVYGIAGSEVIYWKDGASYIYTTHLKLMKGREVLNDEDRNGLTFYGRSAMAGTNTHHFGRGLSVIGNHTDLDVRQPLIFKEPLVFEAGEELTVSLKTKKEGTESAIIEKGYTEIAFIEKVKRTA